MAESVPRRDFLRQVGLAGVLALGLGSGGSWAAELLSRGAPGARGATSGTKPGLLPAQLALLSAVAEGIVPTTNTPGAISAGVPAFIALLYAEWMLPAEQAAFIAGLADLDRDCSTRTGHVFVDCDPVQQLALLRQWDATAARARREGTTLPYFAQLRTLVLIGYYTSEIGQVQELDVQYGGGASHASGPMFSVPSRV